jgi:hypothetical protein
MTHQHDESIDRDSSLWHARTGSYIRLMAVRAFPETSYNIEPWMFGMAMWFTQAQPSKSRKYVVEETNRQEWSAHKNLLSWTGYELEIFYATKCHATSEIGCPSMRFCILWKLLRWCGIPSSQTNCLLLVPERRSPTRILVSYIYLTLYHNTAPRLIDRILSSLSSCIYPMKDPRYPFVWVSKPGDIETEHWPSIKQSLLRYYSFKQDLPIGVLVPATEKLNYFTSEFRSATVKQIT